MKKKFIGKTGIAVAMMVMAVVHTASQNSNAGTLLTIPCEHIKLTRSASKVTDTYSHVFYYKEDINGDGEKEVIAEKCDVTVYENWLEEVCMPCNYNKIDENSIWTSEEHSEKDSIYHP